MGAQHTFDECDLLRVYAASRPSLERYVAQRMHPQLKALVSEEDIVQCTWMRAMRTFDAETVHSDHQLAAWLKAVAFHELIDQARRLLRIPTPVSMWMGIWSGSASLVAACLMWPGKTPSSLVSKEELLELLQHVLESFSVEDREIAALRFVEQMPVAEIAKYVGVSEHSVKRAILRSRQCMRQRFEAAFA